MGDGALIGRRSLRAICLGLIALLYVISVPWYRDTEAPLRIWFGLPDWVAVALLCYVGVAIVNAAAWLLSDVSDVSDDSNEPEDDPVDVSVASLGAEESAG
jgi:hypothetical protein